MTRPIHNEAALLVMAERFKALRKQAGKLQKDIVKDTGLNIGNIEAAKMNITIITLRKLCRYYGITEAEFFEGLEM
ncbi:helix-turn-helix domain-containing protein [Alistipes finegoldii]|uniref:helix-turn-helix domain-containing protein n=1 Tax=Alistipes finegoldii TaxID=214856 RepID=UPI001897D765|nr:helix-turn-helix transcriptional regulator [Alistipes finegoldii]